MSPSRSPINYPTRYPEAALTPRAFWQAIGLAIVLGPLFALLANDTNPYGALTWVLVAVGAVLWLVMTFAIPKDAEAGS